MEPEYTLLSITSGPTGHTVQGTLRDMIKGRLLWHHWKGKPKVWEPNPGICTQGIKIWKRLKSSFPPSVLKPKKERLKSWLHVLISWLQILGFGPQILGFMSPYIWLWIDLSLFMPTKHTGWRHIYTSSRILSRMEMFLKFVSYTVSGFILFIYSFFFKCNFNWQ